MTDDLYGGLSFSLFSIYEIELQNTKNAIKSKIKVIFSMYMKVHYSTFSETIRKIQTKNLYLFTDKSNIATLTLMRSAHETCENQWCLM